MRIVGGVTASAVTKNVGIATSFEEGFHLVEEAVAVCFHRHAALLGEFGQQFFLLGGEFGWNLHLDRKQLIAGGAPFQTGYAESFEPQEFVRLCSWRHFHHGCAFQRGNFDFSAQGRRDEADGNVAKNVVSLSGEELMGLDGDRDV